MSAQLDQIEVSKSAIRERAIAFSKRWADAKSEQAERQLYWNDFFAIFGVSLRNVGFFEVAAQRLSTGNRGWIDLLVPGEMAVEHKSAGEDLNKAMGQLVDYLDSLQAPAMPRLLVACDFQNFYCQNLETKERNEFKLEDLSRNVEVFWWLAGHQEHDVFEDEEAANLIATGYMAQIHDAVLASGYDAHALREWLTRILFCLFADDTEVWDRNAFSNYLFLNTKPDGSDLGSAIAYLFQILNTPDNKRANNLDGDLAAFTYINGDLFAENLPIPSCDEKTRNALLEACKFDWSAISPAIFGSMFQNVMTPAERRHLGAHYTTEENILKTIRPLFLDELEEELAGIKVTSSSQSRARLDAFHDKLASLNFLDPACGCGNFLVIAYRELRRLEAEVLRKRAIARGEQLTQIMDVSLACKVTVGQFYGIELEEFPARIARTALYLMDHKENLAISKEFGQYFARFPIPTSPHIVIGNALRLDWNDVLRSSEADYVMGNPPFVGRQFRTAEQKSDLDLAFEHTKGHGVLDLVTGWFIKAARYLKDEHGAFAFVATNSISQGQNVSALWPMILEMGFRISFAYRPFPWSSEARGKAHVHCVIVGLHCDSGAAASARLFEVDWRTGELTEERVGNITPYLSPGPNVIVKTASSPLVAGIPPALYGSMANDGGFFIFDENEVKEVRSDPAAAQYLRPYVGAEELLRGKMRWCLWLADASPADLRQSAFLMDRIESVRKYRASSTRPATRKLADTPSLFAEPRAEKDRFLLVPFVTSGLRKYIPTAFFEPPTIACAPSWCIPGAELDLFALISSSMFAAWARAVSGRLKSDLRMSPGTVYNTFPFPDLDAAAKANLIPVAQSVFDARLAHPEASLADLYDPLAMPVDLLEAHEELDHLVDSLIAPKKKFVSDADRLAVMFERYEALNDVTTPRDR